MSIRRRLARFNRTFANRLVGEVISRLPGFAMLHHRGRTSGRAYKTPVKVFRRGDEYVISLPYGADSDWVRNVLAAGGCRLRARGRLIPLEAPDIYAADEEPAIPAPIRRILRRVNATEYLSMQPVRVPLGEGATGE